MYNAEPMTVNTNFIFHSHQRLPSVTTSHLTQCGFVYVYIGRLAAFGINIFRRLHEESLTSPRCHPHYQATTFLSFSLRTFDHSISLDTTSNSCSTQSTLTTQFHHRRILLPLPFFTIPSQLPTFTANNSTMVLELHTLLPIHASPTYKSSYHINPSTTHNKTWLD